MICGQHKTEHEKLAEYIFRWLERRNRGELAPALDEMRVVDRRLALDELALILACGGKPPNWVSRCANCKDNGFTEGCCLCKPELWADEDQRLAGGSVRRAGQPEAKAENAPLLGPHAGTVADLVRRVTELERRADRQQKRAAEHETRLVTLEKNSHEPYDFTDLKNTVEEIRAERAGRVTAEEYDGGRVSK